MDKRGLYVVLFVLILFSLSSIFAADLPLPPGASGCCINATKYVTGCEEVESNSLCEGTFESGKLCTEVPACSIGCCCSNKVSEKYSEYSFISNVKCAGLTYSKFNVSTPEGDTNACSLFCGITVLSQCAITDCSIALPSACKCGTIDANAGEFCLNNETVNWVKPNKDECLGYPVVPTFNLTGFVKGNDATPIAGVQIKVQSNFEKINTTINDGSYSIFNLTRGQYSVYATKQGFMPNVSIINIVDSNINLNLTLSSSNQVYEDCFNNTDDDKDNYTDMCDTECNPLLTESLNRSKTALSTETSCNDGVDNDCNGKVDCSDPICSSQPSCNCGNLMLQPEYGEECDPPGLVNVTHGTCLPNCKFAPLCNNGVIQSGEMCDALFNMTTLRLISGEIGLCNQNQYCEDCRCLDKPNVCGDYILDQSKEECELGKEFLCDLGVCIPPGQRYGCSCQYNYTCGDNIITRPFEECDYGSNPIEVWRANNCNYKESVGVYGLPNECLYANTCLDPLPSNITVLEVKESPTVEIKWNDTCPARSYRVLRCVGDLCARSDKASFEYISEELFSKSYTDSITELTTYCYKVESSYASSQSFTKKKQSEKFCIFTGDKECFKKQNEFCYFDSLAKCLYLPGNENSLDISQNCSLISLSHICMGPDKQGRASCVYQSNCDLCGNPFGLFLDNAYTVSENSVQRLLCKDSVSCYRDFSFTVPDKFYPCSMISSCYDYNSKDACSKDKCLINDCSWLDSKYSEESIGVCRPGEENKQDCSMCNNPFNSLYGKCDSNMCSLYGECYLNSNNRCVGKNNIGCSDYYNELDCVNSDSRFSIEHTDEMSVLIDVNKTNAILNRSYDFFNIGLCSWDDNLRRCIKDANYDGLDDCSGRLDDVKCVSDITPPLTLVSLSNNSIIGKNETIRVSVKENNLSGIKTYYSVVKEGANYIYPNILVENSLISFENGLDSGRYTLYYYSIDNSKNMEVVKSVNFIFDSDPPSVLVSYTLNSTETNDLWKSVLNLTISVTDKTDKNVTCKFVFPSSQDPRLKGTPVFGNGGNFIVPNLLDDTYYLNYTCIDFSGNINSGISTILVDADKRIYSPLPNTTINYTGNIVLSVRTLNVSDCRYSEETDNYTLMSNFNSLDKLTHTATIFVAQDYTMIAKRYFVKCIDLNSKKLIGNAADEIRFAVDKTSPLTGAFKGSNEYNLTEWKHSNIEFNLKCSDPVISAVFDSKNWAFSGCKIYYCLGFDCSPVNTGNSSYKVSLNDSSSISFYSVDAGGNQEPLNTRNVQIDKITPNLTLSLHSSHNESILKKIGIVSPAPYVLDLISTEPVYIEEVSIIAGDKFVNLSINENTLIQLEPNKQRLYFVVPFEEFYGLETLASFQVKASDVSGLNAEIINNAPFLIDGKQPEAVVFDPPLSELTNKVGNTFYTNKENLIVTGTTGSDYPLLVSFKYGRNYLDKTAYYQQSVGKALGEGTLLNDAVKSQTDLIILGSSLVSNITAGNTYISFNNHFRVYPNYKQYYLIESVSLVNNNLNIKIKPGLDYPITGLRGFIIYDNPVPNGYFMGNLSLGNRNNLMQVKAIDESLNDGKPSSVYNIFLDTLPIELIELLPSDDWTFNVIPLDTFIKFREHKLGSGFDRQSFGVSLDGSMLSSTIETFDNDTANYDYNVYKANYRLTNILPKEHNVTITASDYSQNLLTKTLNFKYCPQCPSAPVFNIFNSTRSNNRLFIGENVINFNLGFKENVNLTNTTLVPSLNVQLNPLNTASYNGTITGASDGNYEITFSSNRLIDTINNTGRWKFLFTVDTKAPDLNLSFKNVSKSNRTVIIDAIALNEEYDVLAEITINNATFNMTRSGKNTYQFDFLTPIIPRTETLLIPFNVTMKDVLNHVSKKEGYLLIDNREPEIKIQNILSDRKYLIYNDSERAIFSVFDSDNNISIEGMALDVSKVTFKRYSLLDLYETELTISNGLFKIDYLMIGRDLTSTPNVIEFYGYTSDSVFDKKFSLTIYNDKMPPENPIFFLRRRT